MSQSADARFLTSGSLPDTSSSGGYKEKEKKTPNLRFCYVVLVTGA